MFVRPARALVVLMAHNRNRVAPVVDQEWRRFKQVLSSCEQRVGHAMVGVRRSPSHATNARAKERRSKGNILRFLFLPVSRSCESSDLDFSLDSGVEDGQTMRVNLGVSELFVTFRVKPSDKFRREERRHPQ